jgi:mono/diheme cytochrome c family protein
MNPDAPKPTDLQNGPEPVAERRTVPAWLILLFGLLIYWGSVFLAENAGGFASDVYRPYHSSDDVASANPQDPEAKRRALGRQVFEKTCIACHQATGLGKEGTAPPLVGSEWVLAPGGDRIARIVLNGLTGPINVKGQDWNLTMLAWRDTFSDDEIAAVLTYVRSSWGNNAGPIKPELVKAARAEKHQGNETSEELLKISVQ